MTARRNLHLELHAARHPRPTQKRGPEISATFRAAEWWEFKFSPILATVYATAYLLELSLASLWPLLLLALAALVPGAAYVSVINDLTDMEEDLASGKANRLAGRPRAFVAAALACCILPGVAVAIYWRGDPLLLSLYLAAWIAFTLYSLPPVRLKKRGVLGLLADACGAHLFPTLLAVALVYRWRGSPPDAIWFTAVGVWSLGFGARGILWHQVSDLVHDERIDLRTFARRHKIAWLRGLGNFGIFPVELAAFGVMLWRAGSGAAVALLCFYALLELARVRLWRVNLCVSVPVRKFHHIVLHEYYEFFFPLAFILASARRHPLDAVLLVFHLLLFHQRARRTLVDVTGLAADAWLRATHKWQGLRERGATYAGRAAAAADDPRRAARALLRRPSARK